MAGPTVMVTEALDKVAGFLRSQVNDEEKWAVNYNVAKAVSLFAGSIFVMRNFSDFMAIGRGG